MSANRKTTPADAPWTMWRFAEGAGDHVNAKVSSGDVMAGYKTATFFIWSVGNGRFKSHTLKDAQIMGKVDLSSCRVKNPVRHQAVWPPISPDFFQPQYVANQ